MLLALGALSSAMDALQSLTSSKSSSPQTTGFSQNSISPFDVSSSSAASANPSPATGGNGFTQISPETMSALLAAQSNSSTTTPTPTSRSDALSDLFSQLDANSDGKVNKSEFESALGAGGTNVAQADDVFSKLDKNGDGAVSLDEMASALKGSKGHHHSHHATDSAGSSDASGSASADSSSDPLLQALGGASSTSVTNSDGSTTTSVTYADGSTVTLTSPAAQTASSNATSSYNFVEQMIAREAAAISSGATNSLALNV
jgi:Ca2+-binding EF-hand superfamily protein